MLRRGFAHLRRYGIGSLIRHSTNAPMRYLDQKSSLARTKGRFLRRTLSLRRGKPHLDPRPNPDLVVSLTSFPARIATVWATVETLLRQTRLPDAIILVLSLEEFPSRRLPRSLRSLERRGMTIMWVEENIGSFKKLIPARHAYPAATIVTVDDDFLYAPDMLERLVEVSLTRPGWIVGHRGWDPEMDEDSYTPYYDWMKARRRGGPHSDPNEVLLTTGGGTLFPANTPPDWLLLDLNLIRELSPSCDDIWSWGVAKATGVKRYCTGADFGTTNGLEELSDSLMKRNKRTHGSRTLKDVQISAVVDRLPALVEQRKPTG